MEVSSYLTDKRTLDGFDLNSKSFLCETSGAFTPLSTSLSHVSSKVSGLRRKLLNCNRMQRSMFDVRCSMLAIGYRLSSIGY
jgi:hypothetical protein